MSDSARDITWLGGTHRFDLNSPRVRWMVRDNPLPGQYGDTAAACLRRFEEGVYSLADIERVIEIALIGGGMSQIEAAEALAEHVHGKPLASFAILAHQCLIALFIPHETTEAA